MEVKMESMRKILIVAALALVSGLSVSATQVYEITFPQESAIRVEFAEGDDSRKVESHARFAGRPVTSLSLSRLGDNVSVSGRWNPQQIENVAHEGKGVKAYRQDVLIDSAPMIYAIDNLVVIEPAGMPPVATIHRVR